MSGFTSVSDMADTENNGQSRYSAWRKAPTQVTLAGVWFDLSMSPGNPIPQYYAASPLTSIIMARSTDQGLDHGQNAESKWLRKITVMSGSAIAMRMTLLDYLMFYSFADQGTQDVQPTNNTSPLTRYTTGEGVQIMPVSVAAGAGGQTFNVTYTNSDGVAGRTTATVLLNIAAYVGAIANTRAVGTAQSFGPFLTLQGTDRGVRSIESFNMISGTDVGLTTLVLVKPIADISIREQTAPVEVDYFMDYGTVPRIQNDAYLNFICCPPGSLNGVSIFGDITTVWS